MSINTYLTNLCKHSGIDQDQVTIEVVVDGEFLMVNMTVPAEDSGLFIGFHGDTLSSIQRLIRVLFQTEYPDQKIVLNINNYREQRQEKLREMTLNIASRVLDSGRPYTFPFLPPQERFFVHTTLSEYPEFESLESVSEGEGNQRFLVIRPKADR